LEDPIVLDRTEWEGSDDQDKDKAGLKGTEQMGRSSRHHRPLRHKKHFRVMELTAAKFATVLQIPPRSK